MTRTIRLAPAVLLGLAACTVDPNKIKPTVEDLCREVVSVLADRYAECAGSPLAWTHWVLNDQLVCAQWGASVAAGRMGYDESVGSQCISDLRTMPCDQLFGSGGSGPPGACAQAIWGLVPTGSACSTSEDCVTGTYCTYVSACGGTCKAYASLSQYCWDGTTYTQCAPGLDCVNDPAPASTQSCQMPLQAGQLCPSGWGCAAGLYCDRSSGVSATYICRAQQTSGSCGQYDACLEPLYICSGPSISYTTPGTCQPVSREGQACVNGWNQCVWGTYCDTGASAPAKGVAGFCTIFPGPPGYCGTYGGEYVDCLASYCNANACTPFIPVGSPCVSGGPGDQCGSGNFCNTSVSPPVCAIRCP